LFFPSTPEWHRPVAIAAVFVITFRRRQLLTNRWETVINNRWTRDQLKLAFYLYCQLPFGRLHQYNPEIVELSSLIGRTPSALAMKLVNIASIDPAITSTGRSGLGHASALDREIWEQFHADWEALATECAVLKAKLTEDRYVINDSAVDDVETDYSAIDQEAIGLVRVKQNFFRRAVLSSYRGRCCMSGVSDSRLLVASHIVPWSQDRANRLNPRNGLCLSAIHDKAFDRGLITLSDDHRVVVSAALRRSPDEFLQENLVRLDGQVIELPERFRPTQEFIAIHRATVFERDLMALNNES